MAIGNYIFIRPDFKEAPKAVRLYLLAHEYGHIYCQHSYLLFFFVLSAACCWVLFLMSALINSWTIFFLSLLLLGFTIATIAPLNKVEKQADDFAIDLVEATTMYEGCKMVDEKLNRGGKNRERLAYFNSKVDAATTNQRPYGWFDKYETIIYNVGLFLIVIIALGGLAHAFFMLTQYTFHYLVE